MDYLITFLSRLANIIDGSRIGTEIGQATVSKYMVRHLKPPSQSWRAFMTNHAEDIVSVDFLTVPTATFLVMIDMKSTIPLI